MHFFRLDYTWPQNSVADALQLIARLVGIDHYLDDFVILSLNQFGGDLKKLINSCAELGVPLADDKMEGPSMILEILGILIDSRKMQMSLPHAKLLQITSLIQTWRGRKVCHKGGVAIVSGSLTACSKGGASWSLFFEGNFGLTKLKG